MLLSFQYFLQREFWCNLDQSHHQSWTLHVNGDGDDDHWNRIDHLQEKAKKLLPLLSSGLDKKGIPLVLWASNSCILNTWDHFLLHVVLVNLLSPNIHIQILQTGLYTFLWRISWENLIKDQSIFPQVIILLILTTYSLDCVLVSLGENWVNDFICGWLAWPLAHKQGFH